MKLIKAVPNITQYLMRFDKKEDPEIYFRCTWARISLDHTTYTMTAVTDCGDFSYGWKPTDEESFLKLMCRIEKDYLIGKISSCNIFDLKESKGETIQNLKGCIGNCDCDESNILNAIKEIESSDYYDEDSFYDSVYDLVEDFADEDNIKICYRYPERAQTFCRIFVDYLQPILREELK